jgi:hypothetical protein
LLLSTFIHFAFENLLFALYLQQLIVSWRIWTSWRYLGFAFFIVFAFSRWRWQQSHLWILLLTPYLQCL